MFALWEWDWVEDLMEDSSSTTPDNLPVVEDPSSATPDDLPIGSQQPSASNSPQQLLNDMSDWRYQEELCLAAKKRGEGTNVPLKLEPEPDNRYDNKAVTFMCRIGYIVREASVEVNEAIYNNKILGVSFE